MKQYTVCLNMIVKNEESIIYDCLVNLKKYIDTYVIVDTGSTDKTIDEIRRFSLENNLNGEIVENNFNDEYFDFLQKK